MRDFPDSVLRNVSHREKDRPRIIRQTAVDFTLLFRAVFSDDPHRFAEPGGGEAEIPQMSPDFFADRAASDFLCRQPHKRIVVQFPVFQIPRLDQHVAALRTAEGVFPVLRMKHTGSSEMFPIADWTRRFGGDAAFADKLHFHQILAMFHFQQFGSRKNRRFDVRADAEEIISGHGCGCPSKDVHTKTVSLRAVCAGDRSRG